MGERLRPLAAFLEGYDISAAMLKKAEARGVYDRLAKADLQTLELAARPMPIWSPPPTSSCMSARWTASSASRRALRPAGLFAFSVEHHAGPEDFVLRPSRRYAHSEQYLRRLLADVGLSICRSIVKEIRLDRGEPIEGLIIVGTLASGR